MLKDYLILGLETSCDETSVAVVKNGTKVLSNVISSQAELHKTYGGVVPEIASRKHLEYVIPAIDEAIKKADIAIEDIDAVGVTAGPGLVGALLVGVSAAKSIAYTLDKPLIGVNHIEAHIMVNLVENKIDYPFVCLVVSGGHSHIVCVNNYNSFKVLGKTRDDAAGEAFDKVARCLGLGYPGGPIIDKKARSGNERYVDFPRTYFKDSYDFSFSGIKTSVMNYLNKLSMKGEYIRIDDICASFQEAVVSVLVHNTIKAAMDNKIPTVCLAGGVAANSKIRSEMKKKGRKEGISIYYPSPVLCTDNAVMIASLAYYKYFGKEFSDLTLNAVPNLKIGEKIHKHNEGKC